MNRARDSGRGASGERGTAAGSACVMAFSGSLSGDAAYIGRSMCRRQVRLCLVLGREVAGQADLQQLAIRRAGDQLMQDARGLMTAGAGAEIEAALVLIPKRPARSDGRSVRTECVTTCTSRW